MSPQGKDEGKTQVRIKVENSTKKVDKKRNKRETPQYTELNLVPELKTTLSDDFINGKMAKFLKILSQKDPDEPIKGIFNSMFKLE